MIELTSVLIIMLLFVFPLPVLAISLGLFTTWSLYRKSEAFNNQPSEGKKNLILSLVLFLVNIICSIILGVTLAFGIYYFIFDNFYLLIFNFLFCSAISLRWFVSRIIFIGTSFSNSNPLKQMLSLNPILSFVKVSGKGTMEASG